VGKSGREHPAHERDVQESKTDPFIIHRDLVAPAIVELRRARIGVAGHALRRVQCTAIREVCGDAMSRNCSLTGYGTFGVGTLIDAGEPDYLSIHFKCSVLGYRLHSYFGGCGAGASRVEKVSRKQERNGNQEDVCEVLTHNATLSRKRASTHRTDHRAHTPDKEFPYQNKEGKLRRTVEDLLQKGGVPSDAVIALTDVYTGTNDFIDATDAKKKMRAWVGKNEKFHPHAAQYDFEAWLLPFWADIQELAGHNKSAPTGLPEAVNHSRPPSYHIREIFKIGTRREAYSKPRDASRILRGKDLRVPANKCPELKAFLNTILTLSGAEPL